MVAAAAALAAGILLALSFPPYYASWLGWVAIAPVLAAARRRRLLEAVGLGLAAGVLCGAVHVRTWPGPPGTVLAWCPFLWLAMMMGAVAAWSRALPERLGATPRALLVGAAAVTAEWLTAFLPLPISLAYSQSRAHWLLQTGAVTGIWGISFLLWFTNAAAAEALRRRRPGVLLPAAALPLLASGLGGLALARRPAAPTVRVAAIQDYTASDAGVFAEQGASAQPDGDRGALTHEAAARGARLIVWSEGCLGASFPGRTVIDPPEDLARETGAYLVVGYSEPAAPKPYNCAGLVSPDGRLIGSHRKVHLFLGERVGVQPGKGARAYNTALGRIGMEVCFDNCWPDVTGTLAQDRAQLVAVPNLDPPTRRGVLHYLHGAVLPFRAAESGMAFVRADPYGLSQVVDATGRVVAESPLYAPHALVADVAVGDGRGTFYTRTGDWAAWLCVATTVAAAYCLAKARRYSARACAASDGHAL